MIKKYNKNLDFFLKKENLYLNEKFKKKKFIESLNFLIGHHIKNCEEINVLSKLVKFRISRNIENFFYLPVSFFKHYNLFSINKSEIKNKILSSGTSGTQSRIFLDKKSSIIQTQVLLKILQYNLKSLNCPIIFLENEKKFFESELNAKKAAILGFSLISKERHFIIDEKGKLNIDKLKSFLKNINDKKYYIFGFTNNVWQSLINSNLNLNLKNCVLIHGGGWKKLKDHKISEDDFNIKLKKKFQIKKIFNYYGMVEQIGSVFFQCEYGYFHTHSFTDVIIRDNELKSVIKEQGLVQILSILPTSYPGNSILTEDIGKIYGIDDCKCGKPGKYFKIYERVEKSEIRGCSDAY